MASPLIEAETFLSMAREHIATLRSVQNDLDFNDDGYNVGLVINSIDKLLEEASKVDNKKYTYEDVGTTQQEMTSFSWMY